MVIDVNKKLAGILVPAFALRGDDDLGIGNTQAVKEAIDFCHNYGLGVLQLLPINETGKDNSPYNAISALALDFIYIHFSTSAPDMVPGLKKEHWSELSALDNENQLSQDLPEAIDYKRLKTRKHFLLDRAFNEFQSGQLEKYQDLKTEFESFRSENKNWLPEYTLFRSIVSEKSGNSDWTAWEDGLKNVNSAKSTLSDNKELQKSCDFYAYVQWVAHRQWTAVKAYADKNSVKLVGDIPFGVSRYSADVWANQHLFDLQWSGGAPPERFFQADEFTSTWGQNWGIPLYNWSANEKENYAWWRCRIKQTTKYFHGFRLDHVLGFFRIYAFPWLPQQNETFTHLTNEEASQITGGRLPKFMPEDDESEESAQRNCQNGEARLKMILQAAGDAFVVAEDLGTVPVYVRPLLKKMGIPGFAIPIFERDQADRSFTPKEKLPSLSLSTYGTHDNEPLASYYDRLVKWWHSEDGHEGWKEVQRLMHFLGLDENNPPDSYTDALADALLRTLLSTPCWLAMVMITDLLGTRQRFNQPGTSSDSNWSQRLDKTLAEYTRDKRYAEKFNYLRQLIEETHRQPASGVPQPAQKLAAEKLPAANSSA